VDSALVRCRSQRVGGVLSARTGVALSDEGFRVCRAKSHFNVSSTIGRIAVKALDDTSSGTRVVKIDNVLLSLSFGQFVITGAYASKHDDVHANDFPERVK